jgi:membrane protein DedA with SNARE-associated domain/rhodanese-related sulfurtransferase
MPDLLALLTIWGLPIVALAVVLDAGGLPLPAFPVIIAAAAVAMAAGELPLDVLAVATAAALLGDLLWYLAGRRAGRRILNTLCRLSLSPDYCVRQTENLFTRYGAPSLVFAKFVPGFSALATAMAGTYRVGLGWFCLYDGIGSLLWAGTAVLIGVGFAGTFDRLLAVLAGLGRTGIVVVLLALGAWIAARWWQRVRFNRQLRMARISVPELGERLAAGDSPVIIDVRAKASREVDGTIPGALVATLDDADRLARELPRDRDVVIYCACPNEATAALLARRLLGRGVVRVRPLAGGITAWRAAGLPVAGEAIQSPLL